jgi:hypothetical protein
MLGPTFFGILASNSWRLLRTNCHHSAGVFSLWVKWSRWSTEHSDARSAEVKSASCQLVKNRNITSLHLNPLSNYTKTDLNVVFFSSLPFNVLQNLIWQWKSWTLCILYIFSYPGKTINIFLFLIVKNQNISISIFRGMLQRTCGYKAWIVQETKWMACGYPCVLQQGKLSQPQLTPVTVT